MQPTGCGGRVIEAKVEDYLARYDVPAREKTDVRWAQTLSLIHILRRHPAKALLSKLLQDAGVSDLRIQTFFDHVQKFNNAVDPVSYTHLDVYKRQEILGPVQHSVGITGACAVKPLLCLRKGRTVQIGHPG